MPPVATTPRRMEAMARALERAAAQALIPKPRADQLQIAFTATDAEGRSWTIGRESNRWCRLEGEKWLAADPPAELFMDSELRSALEELEAMATGAGAKATEAIASPRAPEAAGGVASIVAPTAASPPPSPEVAGGVAPIVEAAPAPAAEFLAPLLATGIPEAHQRFAGPVAGSVPRAAEPASPADPAPIARASAPPSIAPTLRAAPTETRDDRAHIVLCAALALVFAVLGFWKADARGFAGAALFGVVSVTLTLVNLAQSRHD